MQFCPKKLFIALSLFPFYLYGQNTINSSYIPSDEYVTFKYPEGYVDQQFKELADQYLTPKQTGDLDILLKNNGDLTPELIQRIVDLVSGRVSNEIKKEIIENFKNELVKKQSKEKRIRTGNKKNKNNKKEKSLAKPTQPVIKKVTVIEKPKRKIIKVNAIGKIDKNSSTIGKITISGVKNNKMNINQYSSKNIKINFSAPKNSTQALVKLKVKNLSTGKVLTVEEKTLPIPIVQNNINTSILWNKPNIPMGKYQLFTQIQFFNATRTPINTSTQYWNSSSNTPNIVIKN